MTVLIGFTSCVDESFIKRKELINTNSSQIFLKNTLGNSAREPQCSLIFESLEAYIMIN